jgi:Na+-translocating ferredoxin:NAD+ oxidoreductase RNF subunit RnfB
MNQSEKTISKIPGRSLNVVVQYGVEAQSLHSMLDRILELSGCTACGFQGIDDLTIRVINPDMVRQVGRIEGIEAISVLQSGR